LAKVDDYEIGVDAGADGRQEGYDILHFPKNIPFGKPAFHLESQHSIWKASIPFHFFRFPNPKVSSSEDTFGFGKRKFLLTPISQYLNLCDDFVSDIKSNSLR